jgi:hypothetical protein
MHAERSSMRLWAITKLKLLVAHSRELGKQ